MGTVVLDIGVLGDDCAPRQFYASLVELSEHPEPIIGLSQRSTCIRLGATPGILIPILHGAGA